MGGDPGNGKGNREEEMGGSSVASGNNLDQTSRSEAPDLRLMTSIRKLNQLDMHWKAPSRPSGMAQQLFSNPLGDVTPAQM